MDQTDSRDQGFAGWSRALRWLSLVLFLSALVGIVVLLLSDASRHYSFLPIHQRIAAFPLLLVGLSYICIQASSRRSVSEMVNGVLLGLAFVLWGGEQLLPPSPLVTVMDGAVVTIFVVDLGLVIVGHLRNKNSTD